MREHPAVLPVVPVVVHLGAVALGIGDARALTVRAVGICVVILPEVGRVGALLLEELAGRAIDVAGDPVGPLRFL